ncbi:AraC family transcriptional regulator [Methylobacterium sp. C25]|uniref:AraC family transcriptional regulator n=1 Tax=Methylobacterium sp. C25 TaxID=2721622 RepID=UPI001F416898|nr:AraC family transcriptional regulator [Methylobacterium sp. C25]MCE4225370.1 AraC family transcriptional regulator [Methylobacterium sp. C25]
MIERLENLTDPPEDGTRGAASLDLLSHVLSQIRLTGDGVSSETLPEGGRLDLDPDAAHAFVITGGGLHASTPDEASPVLIETGDLVLIPNGVGATSFVASQPAQVVVCRFRFDPYTLRSMIAALPRRIHIRRDEGAGWLDGIVHFLMIETTDTQPGAALMISRIIDVLVIRTLRTWVQRGQSSGWLGGLSDARIARALKAIHQEPMQPWSVEALADLAGMSRSSFAGRFTQLVGLSPLRYQNAWRLTIAQDLLSRRGARVGEVAHRVGYESEAAFSRAYKALFGHSPRDEAAQSLRTEANE